MVRSSDCLERNQQRNYESLVQVISIRAQPFITEPIKAITLDTKDTVFGTQFLGPHKVWVLHFDVEHKDVFTKDNDPVGLLAQDIDNVPVITNLTESAYFESAMFSSTDYNRRNVYFTFEG
jgi:hypothetical protein